MLFGTCDGLNSYDGNGMWLTAQNTGVVLYGNLVEDVKTVGGSMWVLTNYGLNIVQGATQNTLQSFWRWFPAP